MAKRVRVVSAGTPPVTAPTAVLPRQNRRAVVVSNTNPNVNLTIGLTEKERRVRLNQRRATATTMGMMRSADVLDSGTSQFYSPQLSTDFLEKPQNLRERRAFYRFFYNTNEIVRRALDIHSTMPLSKLRLVPPKGKNKHQNDYVFKFYEKMCEEMKLFKTLIEITHEYNLFGNCTPASSLIRTNTGFRLAGNIAVGDKVLTHIGRYRKVLAVARRFSDSILRIKCLSSYLPLPVTGEHPVEIYRKGIFNFVPANEIIKGDFIRITWPVETVDIDRVDFPDYAHFNKLSNGYERDLEFTRRRAKPEMVVAKKRFTDWLASLKAPVIKTRSELATLCGTDIKGIDKIVMSLNKEIGYSSFHERKGPLGFKKGSQVMWKPFIYEGNSASYRMTRKIFYNGIKGISINDDFAYMVGYWMGDGTLGKDSAREYKGRGLWQICGADKSKSSMDRIHAILINFFGDKNVKKWVSNGITYLKVNGNPIFIEWWKENFGESYKQTNKGIPEWFMKLPVSKLKSFLAGVIDSDGCSSLTGHGKAIVQVTMTSPTLIQNIREVALKCGAVFSMSHRVIPSTRLPRGKISSNTMIYNLMALDEISCRILTEKSEKKLKSCKFSKSNHFLRLESGDIAFKVVDVEVTPGEEVVNFEVDEDHTYQINGYSTHNCFLYAEDDYSFDDMAPDERSRKKEESRQKAEYLNEKYQIKDKDPAYKGWRKVIVLPPDQVRVRKLPLTDEVAVDYVPDPETKRFLTSEVPIPDMDRRDISYSIPKELQDKVRQSGIIPLDTDPYTGSHVFHLARKKSQYEPLGVSIIESCVNTLVLLDKLRQAQTSIASRHMTPMRIVWAEDLNPDDVDNLREQVDLALVDPDFSIIANYEIHWEEMGSQGRLLDITGEYEGAMTRLLAGLEVSREILTGEGTWSGNRITLEIMNTQYLLYRELIQDYVENFLFKPVAKKKGFVEYDEYGNEILLYPRLSFTRLAIRDNEQFFDAAFQLYQKGSISIDLILDILNIDPESTREKIERDLFTVNDPAFVEVMRNLYTTAAGSLVEKTNATERIASYLKLNMIEPEAPAEGASRFSSEDLAERKKKIAKVMKYLMENPEALDRIFSKKDTT